MTDKCQFGIKCECRANTGHFDTLHDLMLTFAAEYEKQDLQAE